MKHNKKIIGIFLSLIFFTSITLAYMFRKTDPITNQLEPAVVSCEVHEKVNGSEPEQTTNQTNVITKDSITIKNTGNIDAYIRIKLVTYWINDNKQVVNKEMPQLNISMNADNWVYNAKQDIYYYKNPVKPNEFTSNLLSASIPLNNSSTEYQVIDVFAEAIQSQPIDAIIDSWQVNLDDFLSIK